MVFFRGFGELPAFVSLFDPGWWNRMLDSTTSGHASPEALILTAAIFATAGICIAAGLFIKIRIGRQDVPPTTWIVRPGEIRALLDTALTQRSKVRVSFVRDDPGARSTDATILSADPRRGIELEMTALVRAHPSWAGKLVACDFRLRLDPKKDYHTYYNFVAPILAVRKAGDEFIHMSVAWPTRLELEQKRGFLRVDPPRTFVLELELWHESTIKNSRGRFGEPATWGPPIVRLDPRREVPDVEVRNISGGGLRLEILAESIRRDHGLFEPASRFLMRLVLAEPEADQPMEFHLALRLQNAYGDPGSLGQKAYGFRFLSFGVPSDAPGDSLSWKPAASGVPALDDWAFRRHLAIYRSRGE
uniref:PilZ domain-containing protein n=1 Tax=Desulfovibrio sp. U5L TaxID=596152 RepID=I2Q2B5_9BACT